MVVDLEIEFSALQDFARVDLEAFDGLAVEDGFPDVLSLARFSRPVEEPGEMHGLLVAVLDGHFVVIAVERTVARRTAHVKTPFEPFEETAFFPAAVSTTRGTTSRLLFASSGRPR